MRPDHFQQGLLAHFEGVNGKGLSRKHITESIDATMKRLQLDYVDLYFCHRYDPDTTIEEVVQTMDKLVRVERSCIGEPRSGRRFILRKPLNMLPARFGRSIHGAAPI